MSTSSISSGSSNSSEDELKKILRSGTLDLEEQAIVSQIYANNCWMIEYLNRQNDEPIHKGSITSAAAAAPAMDFQSSDTSLWREALSSYEAVIKNLAKPNLIPLDDFYRKELPNLLHQRDPNPYITTEELSRLMEWKLARGKWRPRLLSFVSSLDDAVVRVASTKAFASLPDVSTAVSELTVLKGVGPATASAVLAAYSPDVAPFMSDEAMVAVLGDSKDYSLKRYMAFVEKMQDKAKELSSSDDLFTPSDIERAMWSCTLGARSKSSSSKSDKVGSESKSKRKRKR